MKRIAIVIAVLFVVALVFVAAAAEMLAHPVQRHIGNAPADVGGRNIEFRSDSGTTIHGWLCEAPNARAAVLLLPGVRGNRLAMLDRARFLRRASYSVLLIDFQATGESIGKHITFGWLESRDVLAAVAFLRREQPQTKIAIIGQSLGGAATLLATPPLHVDAIVIEQVYATIENATKNRLRRYFGPIGPLAAPLLLWQLKPRLGAGPEQLRPIDHIGRVNCPILVIGGLNDVHAPETRAMFDHAREPKSLWLVPKASHVDLYKFAGAEYEQRILAFLSKSCG